jgi:hypothetical protein
MMAEPPKNPPGDYEVGYGRPPRRSQFQPGHSGNPNGRPKGQPTASEIFAREAARVVRMKVGDKIESISKLEAVFRTLFNIALAGDQRAIGMILAAHARLAVGEVGQDESDEQAFAASAPDEDALRRMLARFEHLHSD